MPPTDVEILNWGFELFCQMHWQEFIKINPSPGNAGVPYIYNPTVYANEDKLRNEAWNKFITPLTERWWLEKGYKVIWHNNKPPTVEKL
jgi:hypothetical protein